MGLAGKILGCLKNLAYGLQGDEATVFTINKHSVLGSFVFHNLLVFCVNFVVYCIRNLFVG